MGRLITVEELPQYAGGDLKLDSVATEMPEFRMRVFRYAPSDISVPPCCRSRSCTSAATTSTSGGEARAASAPVKARLCEDCLLGEGDVSVARLGERPDVRRGIGRGLLRHRLVHLLAVAGDRMRGADVRAWRHRRHVCRERQDEARRRRPRPRRRDEDNDRRARGEDPRDDRSGGLEQPAWRAKDDDDKCGARRSASSITPVRYSAAIGWMIPSSSATTTVGRPVD